MFFWVSKVVVFLGITGAAIAHVKGFECSFSNSWPWDGLFLAQTELFLTQIKMWSPQKKERRNSLASSFERGFL